MFIELHYKQRSAVPAVSSRISGEKRKTCLMHPEKDRLLRMAKPAQKKDGLIVF